jgi:hypothetical protein
MPIQYVLIDHENVQPKDLGLLDGQALKVIVFLGANQSKISAELATALQRRGNDGEYIRISGSGRNALDFHIAFYLGDLAARYPDAKFRVISKDDGYDPLLSHLRSKGIEAQRSATLAEILPPAADKLESVIAHLKSMGPARPKKLKTLASTVKSRLGTESSETEVQTLVEELKRRGLVSVKTGNLFYSFSVEG